MRNTPRFAKAELNCSFLVCCLPSLDLPFWCFKTNEQIMIGIWSLSFKLHSCWTTVRIGCTKDRRVLPADKSVFYWKRGNRVSVRLLQIHPFSILGVRDSSFKLIAVSVVVFRIFEIPAFRSPGFRLSSVTEGYIWETKFWFSRHLVLFHNFIFFFGDFEIAYIFSSLASRRLNSLWIWWAPKEQIWKDGKFTLTMLL